MPFWMALSCQHKAPVLHVCMEAIDTFKGVPSITWLFRGADFSPADPMPHYRCPPDYRHPEGSREEQRAWIQEFNRHMKGEFVQKPCQDGLSDFEKTTTYIRKQRVLDDWERSRVPGAVERQRAARAAYVRRWEGVRAHHMVVIGDKGVGKTTFLKQLFRRWNFASVEVVKESPVAVQCEQHGLFCTPTHACAPRLLPDP